VLSERLQQLPPPLSVHGGSASPIREEAGREGLGVQPSDELSAEPRKARARPRACARARTLSRDGAGLRRLTSSACRACAAAGTWSAYVFVGRCVGLEPLFLARGAVRREAHWITLAARCGRVPAAGSGASGGVRASCARLWQVRVLRAARAVHGPGPLVAGADAGVHERQRRLGAGPGRHRVPGEDRGRRVWRPVQGRLLRAGRGDKDPAQRAGRHAAVPGVPAGARRAAGPGFWRGGASRAAGACVPSAKACRRAAGRAAVDCG